MGASESDSRNLWLGELDQTSSHVIPAAAAGVSATPGGGSVAEGFGELGEMGDLDSVGSAGSNPRSPVQIGRTFFSGGQFV